MSEQEDKAVEKATEPAIPDGVPAPTGAEIVSEKPPAPPPKDPIAERAERRAARKEEKDRKVIIAETMRKWSELPTDAVARDREALERLWKIVGQVGPDGRLQGIIPELQAARQRFSIQLGMAGSRKAESEPIIAQMEIICRQFDRALDEYSSLVSALSGGIRSRWEQATAHKRMIDLISSIPELPAEPEGE